MFSHSVINNGTFLYSALRDSDSVVSSPKRRGFNILHSRIASGAFHDSGERFDAPKCHPGTREAVLKEIMRWVEEASDSVGILWLYGPAGAGKSAIAQNIAELCSKFGLLLGTFFFSRIAPLRKDETRLIASIAYQLAISVPETREFINKAVEKDPSIFERSLEAQMETLVVRPLEQALESEPAFAAPWPKLIIIDGLDDCHGLIIQRKIIEVLSSALDRVPLLLFIATRPEPHIRNAFNVIGQSSPSYHIVLDDTYHPDSDIRAFLLSRFQGIKDNHPLNAYIPSAWPSADVIDALVRKSSGQFIYASTVMKFLDSHDHRPTKRLNIVLGLSPPGEDIPYKELDTLYIHIFSSVKRISGTLRILGVLVFNAGGTPHMTPEFIESFLSLEPGEVHLSLFDMHSIVYIPSPLGSIPPFSIRILHASLDEFLVDKKRSGIFYLDTGTVHEDMARCCLRIIQNDTETEEYPLTVEDYANQSLVYHCTRVTLPLTAGLEAQLLQMNLKAWMVSRDHQLWDELPAFFEWLEQADKGNGLHDHHQSAWDQYILAKLNKYFLNGNNIGIVGMLLLPDDWKLQWLSAQMSSREAAVIRSTDKQQLKLLELGNNHQYRQMLLSLFEDRKRAGKYHLDGLVYARAAVACIKSLFDESEPEYGTIITSNLSELFAEVDHRDIYHPEEYLLATSKSTLDLNSDNDQVDLESSYWPGIHYTILLLSKACHCPKLTLLLQNHPLHDPSKAAIHDRSLGLADVRSAVSDYLKKHENTRRAELPPSPSSGTLVTPKWRKRLFKRLLK
ncbi:hypothetical protein B0H34DRAFT_800822 [Crassisporium funariophilum]|nr:hypothetical protein B0H34DRAFT_800822 [Crassisporium funariophilum]